MKGKTLVVIPYLAKAAQGNELEYAVTGWRKHFKDPYLIVVVGDYHPITDTGDDICFVSCPRVKWPGKGNYWAHIDHVNKFLKVREMFPTYKGFIYTCDDIYAVKDFTLNDVKRLKVRCRDINCSFPTRNKWVIDNLKTKLRLKKEKLPTMNWVCHLPVYYEWDKLLAIYDEYDCRNTSYVVENLYFNKYHSNDDYIVIEEDSNNYQFKLWDKRKTINDFRCGIQDKMWVCNSVFGWMPEMEEALREHYSL